MFATCCRSDRNHWGKVLGKHDVQFSSEIARNRVDTCVWRVVCLSDVAVCFRDKSQLKWRFWWIGVRSERVKIIPNGVAWRKFC